MRREEILEILHSGPTSVRFIKNDGSFRDMRCTLNREILSEHLPPREPGTTPAETNPNLIRVFDLEKLEFRSFRVDSVTSVKAES